MLAALMRSFDSPHGAHVCRSDSKRSRPLSRSRAAARRHRRSQPARRRIGCSGVPFAPSTPSGIRAAGESREHRQRPQHPPKCAAIIGIYEKSQRSSTWLRPRKRGDRGDDDRATASHHGRTALCAALTSSSQWRLCVLLDASPLGLLPLGNPGGAASQETAPRSRGPRRPRRRATRLDFCPARDEQISTTTEN